MVPDITLGRTDTTLDLSSKEPRSDTDSNRWKHLFNSCHLDFEGKLSARMNLDMFEKSSKYNPPVKFECLILILTAYGSAH